ncbi:MAG: glycosyltransferase family 4 protein [Flavobacteriales bacterium]|nr:glycosyltransferase family 4 protein [Flavobacteriales bacterium]
MNIAVNTRLLLKGRLEGIGRFTHETMSRVVKLMPEHRFHFFFDRAFDNDFIYAENVIGHAIFPPARHPLLYNLWFHHAIPRAIKKHNVDLFFSPEGYLPLDSSVPCINVMHDINFEHHPEMVPPKHSRHFRKYFPKYAHAASKIITVSEFSRSDIAKCYDIDPQKIFVVYNGVSKSFSAIDDLQRTEYQNQITQGDPYFVFIGSIHPRKNLARLIKAFDHFKQEKKLPHKLVVVGKKAFMNDDLEVAYHKMKFQSEVLFTGRLEQETMIKTLAAAEALVYIPIYEGFGIPIIEAFKCEVPVITANSSALPEIAGGAALLVDPFSIDSIKEGLISLAENGAVRRELIESGRNRSTHFDWDRTAAEIVEILKRNLG